MIRVNLKNRQLITDNRQPLTPRHLPILKLSTLNPEPRFSVIKFIEGSMGNLIDIKGYCVKNSIEMAVKTKAV